MRYSLTFLERDLERLRDLLCGKPGVENAAYLLCRLSSTASETRLLVREIVAVEPDHILRQTPTGMKIASASFRGAMKRADEQDCSFAFVHTHPDVCPSHSEQDDREELPLFRTAYARVHNEGVHASLVFTNGEISAARIWLPDGSTKPIERVRVVGSRLRFLFPGKATDPIPEFFDRQVRAFGRDIQILLQRLRVGVVGAGGTGSAVIEQLVRLGVGHLTVADGETFEASNVNRVYGSRVIDESLLKTKIAERLIADIGLGTEVLFVPRPITYRSALSEFRNCDVVFGCTDDTFGRSLLTRFAIYYGIPVFDMGVKIASLDGMVQSINGRVTTLMPGTACLFCRDRISSAQVGHEALRAMNPTLAQEHEQIGYVPELGEPAPAVVSFTTATAAMAVNEFLNRITGFMGEDRPSSETIYLFDQGRIRQNFKLSQPGCFCEDGSLWNAGDTKPFMDCVWRPE